MVTTVQAARPAAALILAVRSPRLRDVCHGQPDPDAIGACGGVSFTQGPLFYMLRNRFYVGEVKFKDEILGGPQPPLVERPLFEAVQNKLTVQWLHRNRKKQKNQAMLSGLLFDDAGHPMVTTYAIKNRVRYRYYMSAPLRRGRSDNTVGSVSRVPADEIEAIVGKAVCDHLQSRGRSSPTRSDEDAIRAHLERIDQNALTGGYAPAGNVSV
jgi:site-specific DNA recombinase